MKKWFSKWWWQYLLENPAYGTPKLKAFLCRTRGHPSGVWWHNPGGLEPDMHCKDCGDDIG
jgi:hypothetical protein